MNGRRLAVNSMQVVSPPWTTARSQAARWRYSSGTYARTSSPSCDGSDSGSILGPVTTIIRSPGTRRFASG